MYTMYTMNNVYTIAEFRKKTREAINLVDAGEEVYLERYGIHYQLMPPKEEEKLTVEKRKDWNIIDLGPDEPKQKQPSIDEQLETLGLVRDPTLSGKAFNPDNEQYVPYKVVNGIVTV